MEATQTANPQNGNPPTFESVWAGFQEFSQGMKELRESQKEYALHLKETERILKEDSKRLKDELNTQIGSLTNLFGDVTEAMVAPKICEKFNEFGFNFLKASPNPRYNDRGNGISFEVDIMLENSEKAMLIEVKTKLTLERIDKHILRLEKMRKYADLHGDKRIFLGAVAGIVVTDEVRDYALSKGFYFIEYAGETFYITAPNGKPKEW
jgi:predicted AAA+ superfamily ATPase